MHESRKPSECLRYRVAKPADAAALLAIYEPYLATTVTFECELPSVEEFERRIREHLETYPYIVCELDGLPVGYAYASRLYGRAAYDWAAELSVYLAQECRGRGIGPELYRRLIELLGLQGIRSVHGKVASPNERSEGLHRSMGFTLAGVQHAVGYKLGSWHDVTLYEKALAQPVGEPAPLIPFPELDPQAVLRTLES